MKSFVVKDETLIDDNGEEYIKTETVEIYDYWGSFHDAIRHRDELNEKHETSTRTYRAFVE